MSQIQFSPHFPKRIFNHIGTKDVFNYIITSKMPVLCITIFVYG